MIEKFKELQSTLNMEKDFQNVFCSIVCTNTLYPTHHVRENLSYPSYLRKKDNYLQN